MKRRTCAALGVAMAFAMHAGAASTIQIDEDFSTNPSGRWSVFGDATRFEWNSDQQNLRVEWDSSKPKSFFHLPTGRTLTRYDTFAFAFDLVLDDMVSGHESGKTGPLQIGVGLLNFNATNASWSRAMWGSASDIAEFNAYPSGYWAGWGPVEATTLPSFVASNGNGYLASTAEFIMALPASQIVRVSMSYNAEMQMLTAVWTTNGVPVGQSHQLILGKEILFSPTEDFAVNIFSISNYESTPWDSVLAHGSVDNISITIPPPPPIVLLRGGFAEGQYSAVFRSRTDYSYTLERTDDFSAWTPVVESVPGTGTDITLSDPNPPSNKAFYRVRANP